MPDMDELNQILMLSNLMSSMPPQNNSTTRVPFPKGKAQQWATELVKQFGVRVHPDLAADPMEPEGAAVTRQPRRRIDAVTVDGPTLLKMLRDAAPNVPRLQQLADRIEDALGDPVKTEAELQRIRFEEPDIYKSAAVLAEQLRQRQASS